MTSLSGSFRKSLSLVVVFFDLFLLTTSLTCHQCNGWSGRGYHAGRITNPTCDNRNNQCYTTQYCVKIVDPIQKNKHYATYKSDCWYASTFLANNTITETVSNNVCYGYSDGGTPPIIYKYCFCNDKDYCNEAPGASRPSLTMQLLVTLSTTLLSGIVAN